MGYVRKGLLFVAATLSLTLAAVLIHSIGAYSRHDMDDDSFMVLVAMGLICLLIYIEIVAWCLGQRCGECRSLNVWRNAIPRSDGEGLGRSTYCYKCKRQTAYRWWARPRPGM